METIFLCIISFSFTIHNDIIKFIFNKILVSMVKSYIKTIGFVLSLISLLILPMSAFAQIQWQENFDYPVGNLNGQGGWGNYGSNPNDPIQVVDQTLAYEGYPGGVKGKSVRLTQNGSAEDLLVRFDPSDDGVKEGCIYASVLVNLSELPTKAVYSLTLLTRTKSSVVVAGKTPSEFGKVFFAPAAEAGKYKIGVDRVGSNPVYVDGTFDLNVTNLLVLKYAIKAEDNKDVVSLFVNPKTFNAEPTTADAVVPISASGSHSSNGFQGFELRQAGTSKDKAPDMLVGSLRIADSYAGLFGTSAEEPKKDPTITFSKDKLNFGALLSGMKAQTTLTVKGQNLTSDVTVSSSNSELTVSPTTLAAQDLMSSDGAQLTLTLNTTAESANNATLTFTTEGMTDVTAQATWYAEPVVDVVTLKELTAKDSEEGLTYRYTGEAVVTFVDNSSSAPVYYLQDATAGLMIKDANGVITHTYKQGDKLTGFIGMLANTFGVVSLEPTAFYDSLGVCVSHDNIVEAKELTLAQLKEQAKVYVNQLVRIKGATINANGATSFAEGMAQPEIADASDVKGKLRIFKGTSLIGTDIPTESVTVTGLTTSVGAVLVAPRGKEDIQVEEQGEPALEVSDAKNEMFEGYVGKSINIDTLHVSAKYLPEDATIEIIGTGKKMFETSVSTIKKGSSETDVIISYVPTAIGKHLASILIDCPSVPTLSKTIKVQAYAIDEQNPPVVTVEPTTVAPFEVKVGETQEQTITVTTAHLPDYANIKVAEAGIFRINNSMLMKDATNQIKVTFAPLKAGSYDNELIISALGVDTIKVALKGVAKENVTPEPDKEGDNLPLDVSNPVKLLNETFSSVEKNKPIKIEGWKNLAITGQRAWWGYEFGDTDESVGEKVAKVTAYDSKLSDDEESPVEMLLVTPALDFKNSESKMFTFRVRGDYLLDDQTDTLQLCYIDMEDPEGMFVAPVGGITMPCTKDESGEWNEYHIDLTGQDLADTFFMGFRFKSVRGRNHSATYYIDDVTYGRTDIPLMRPSESQLAFVSTVSKDAESAPVKITAENLVNPITLTVGGANKSKFKLSVSQLPKEGGEFTVKFHSDDEGVHEAYVKLASRGAADIYIPVSVNNTVASSISAIDATPADITVYNLKGEKMAESKSVTPTQIVKGLPAGIYVIQKVSASGIHSYKVSLK